MKKEIKKNTKIKPCVVCSNENNEPDYLNTGVLIKCMKCGMLYTNLEWEEEVLNSNLDSWWYDTYHFSPERLHEAQEQINSLKTLNINSGKLLDYGCGAGNFLKLACDAGFEGYGIEIDSSVANIIKEKLGLNVQSCTINTLPFDENEFDVITLWNVLEHCPEPSKVISKLYTILKPGGYLIIEVPNNNSINKRLAVLTYLVGIKRFFYHLYLKTSDMPGSHVSHFDENSLKKLLKSNNLKIIDAKQKNSPINLVSETFNKGAKVPLWFMKPILIILNIIGILTKTQSRIVFIARK